MNWKTNQNRATNPGSNAKATLSFSGGGKVSVSVTSVISSPKVQRQVTSVREIAASQAITKTR